MANTDRKELRRNVKNVTGNVDLEVKVVLRNRRECAKFMNSTIGDVFVVNGMQEFKKRLQGIPGFDMERREKEFRLQDEYEKILDGCKEAVEEFHNRCEKYRQKIRELEHFNLKALGENIFCPKSHIEKSGADIVQETKKVLEKAASMVRREDDLSEQAETGSSKMETPHTK